MGQYSTSGKSEIEQSIIKTLLYYDIFSYPLTYREIKDSIASGLNSDIQFDTALDKLCKQGLINEYKGYYYLKNDWKVSYREQGNNRANRYWFFAKWISKFIAQFPFVRGVMISGSLSKGMMDKRSDIDYFIITTPGRLWVCRSFLILFKKIFLLNSYKVFCLNYFVDSENLEIEDKNLFTATELVTLKATYNSKLYHKLLASNDWTQYYYPNFPQNDLATIPDHKRSFVKIFLEKVLSGKWGENLDNFFMHKTRDHWKKKFNSCKPEKTNSSLKSRKYISKQNNFDFQAYVLNTYKKQIRDFEAQYQVGLQLNGELKLPEREKAMNHE